MSNPGTTSDWLQNTLQNLSRDGFVVSENVGHASGTMRAVARRTRFEVTKFGFSETFFVFREFESISNDVLRTFSSVAFQLAKQSRTIPLPCGIFESVWCFAVAILNRAPAADRLILEIEDDVIASVRSAAPTKHWAAAEIPVIFHKTAGKLYYFEKTPLWGAAYYAGFRSQIKRYLGQAGQV